MPVTALRYNQVPAGAIDPVAETDHSLADLVAVIDLRRNQFQVLAIDLAEETDHSLTVLAMGIGPVNFPAIDLVMETARTDQEMAIGLIGQVTATGLIDLETGIARSNCPEIGPADLTGLIAPIDQIDLTDPTDRIGKTDPAMDIDLIIPTGAATAIKFVGIGIITPTARSTGTGGMAIDRQAGIPGVVGVTAIGTGGVVAQPAS